MKRAINHRLPVLGPSYRPPPTRGHCIAGTKGEWAETGSRDQRQAGELQCAALGCRYSLLRIDSDDIAGRRHNGLAPEWTLRGDNVSASAPSCTLDVCDTGPKSAAEIAEVMGYEDKRIVEMLIKRAEGKTEMLKLAMQNSELMEEVE